MPNGKPGDHPYTDILHYGQSEFGEPVDGLVKQLSKMAGFQSVFEEVRDLLWEFSPLGRLEEKDALSKDLFGKLEAIRQHIALAEEE